MSSRVICRIVWIPSLIALVGLLGFQPKIAPAEAAVEAMKPFVSSDRRVALQAPGNWKAKQSSSHGVESEVKFSPGNGVVFTVTSDESAAAMADIMKSFSTMASSMEQGANSQVPGGQGAGMPGGQTQMPNSMPGMGGSQDMPGMQSLNKAKGKSPLEFLHELQASELKHAQQEFRDGATQRAQVAGYEALVTQMSFTASKGLTAMDVVGERVTFVGKDRGYSVIYRCPKDQKDKLMPVFRQMLASLRVNEQGGN